jgi:translation initiation factor 2B subunit (eIF-2B alpha/beta/delta family)
MKLLKDKINEYIDLYLNDLSDYGDDGEHEIAEAILNPFKTTIDESEGDTYNLLKEASKQSPEHKQAIVEFLEYLKHTQND